MKNQNGIQKVNKICKEVLALSDDDFEQVREMAKGQSNYIQPLKPATSARQQELGDYNTRVLKALQSLHEIIKSGTNIDDDQCQPCHNALNCLAWAREGAKAKCDHWGYFKKHYASGNKKIIGAEILDE